MQNVLFSARILFYFVAPFFPINSYKPVCLPKNFNLFALNDRLKQSCSVCLMHVVAASTSIALAMAVTMTVATIKYRFNTNCFQLTKLNLYYNVSHRTEKRKQNKKKNNIFF